MISLKQLEALRWIAVLGSFEKAAERLHATQSAISKRILELEASLGTPVFDRNGRSSRLTDKGREVLRLAEQMLGLRDEVMAIGARPTTMLRRLRFGVTELTAITWLPQLVAEIRAAYPLIALEPEVEMSGDLAQSLEAGALDFIVVPDSVWHAGFRSVPLASVQNAWLASPELFVGTGIIPLAALARLPILTQGMRSGSGMRFGKWIEESGVNFPRQVTSNSLVALVGLTVAALGVSYLPLPCFQGLVDRGALRVIETDPPLPAVPYALMFRSEESSNVVSAIVAIARRACDFATPVRWN